MILGVYSAQRQDGSSFILIRYGMALGFWWRK